MKTGDRGPAIAFGIAVVILVAFSVFLWIKLGWRRVARHPLHPIECS